MKTAIPKALLLAFSTLPLVAQETLAARLPSSPHVLVFTMPEPSSLALLAVELLPVAALIFLLRRRVPSLNR